MSILEELDRENFLSPKDAKKQAEELVVEIKGINALLPLWDNQLFITFLDLLRTERLACIRKMEGATNEYQIVRASGSAMTLGRLIDMKDTLKARKKALEVQLSKVENGETDAE